MRQARLRLRPELRQGLASAGRDLSGAGAGSEADRGFRSPARGVAMAGGGGARLLLLAVLAASLSLGGCKRANMYSQAKSDNWDRSNFFPDGQSMRLPVAGTVPRAEPHLPVPQPSVITAAMVERGHERFNIFCTPCHGRAGDGQGMIVQRGFPQPPDFASDAMRRISAQTIYDTITYGRGAMYSHADRVAPDDRWAIAAYIRALQLSRGVAVASLSPAERARLDNAPVEPPAPDSVHQPDAPIGATTATVPGTNRNGMATSTLPGSAQ